MPATVTPEQLPPEPITQAEQPVPAGVPGRRPASKTEVLLSVVPGLGHVVRGEWAPGCSCSPLGFTVSLALLARPRSARSHRPAPGGRAGGGGPLALRRCLLWGWPPRHGGPSRAAQALHGDSKCRSRRGTRKNRWRGRMAVMLLLYWSRW